MPKGPNGEQRPADTNACAVMVGKIATGEIDDPKKADRGSAGGKARADRMSSERRIEVAKRAARARWGKEDGKMDRLDRQLFASEGKKLVNIKFAVGHGENISEADFRDAVARRLFQIDNGLAETLDNFGDKDRQTVQVSDVIKRLG